MTVNWKNAFENALYVGFGFVLGAFIVFIVMKDNNASVHKQLQETIAKAIDKESIKNENVNEIELKIDKIKNSDTLQININQEPINNQKPKSQIIKTEEKQDSIKKGFFGRLFSTDNYKKI